MCKHGNGERSVEMFSELDKRDKCFKLRPDLDVCHCIKCCSGKLAQMGFCTCMLRTQRDI